MEVEEKLRNNRECILETDFKCFFCTVLKINKTLKKQIKIKEEDRIRGKRYKH